jgi:hypothetical protein
VNFHTGKELHDVQRCHLNAAVFDMDWERQAGEQLRENAQDAPDDASNGRRSRFIAA